jgi:hypothetical protein
MPAYSYQKMNVLLGKVQSALGTKQSSLAYGDFRTIDDTFELTYNAEMIEQNLAQGFFGQPQTIKGMQSVDCKVSMPIIPTGSTTAPNVHDFMTCCGMKAELATNLRTYTPSSDVATDWKDMTLWGYSGSKVTSESLLTKAHSVMFDAELAFELGKPALATFTGKGVPDGKPDSATYVSGTLAVLSGAVPAVLKATTMTVCGYSLNILKANVKIGNDVQLIKSASDNSGYLQSMIAGRKSTWSATVYEETPASKNVFDLLDGQTLGLFQMTFGTAGSRITVASTAAKCEITSVKTGNDAGINTWEVSGSFIDNDFAIKINDA